MSDQVPEPQPDQGLDQRVSSLETGQENLSGKIDKILGILGGGDDTQAHGEEPSGGTNIAHEIRAQLEEQERRKAAEAAEQGKADRLAAAEAKIAELAEKPPAPMPRRVEKFMGWR